MAFDLVVDTSVLVAIIREELGFEVIHEQLGKAQTPCIPSPTVLETLMVLTSSGQENRRSQLEDFLETMTVRIVAFDEDDYRAAYSAFLRFGKGRHPAALNFGDCMVYALAAKYNAPILCTGDDFTQTDIQIAGY